MKLGSYSHWSVNALAVSALAALVLAAGPPAASAGCLAPTDGVADGASLGPMWGSSGGTLMYSRNLTGSREALVLLPVGSAPAEQYAQGERNGFFVGPEEEEWVTFHAGTINSDDDLAIVASTTIDDDPGTIPNESIPRRGLYARKGNTLRRIGRFGQDSPLSDAFGTPIVWGSFFEAVALGRDAGSLSVVFSAQLGSGDGRVGIFRWDEATLTISPLVLVGDPAPLGGTFSTIAGIRANEAGDVAFLGLTQSGGTITPGLFLAPGGGVPARVVRFGTSGDAAPGGGSFSILNDFAIDDAATLHFAATVTGARKSGLFRSSAPLYSPELILHEGDATPLGGRYLSLSSAILRVTPGGELLLSATLSDDLDSEGLFSFEAGTTQALPIVNPESIDSIAALGLGRAAYQSAGELHVVVPATGEEEGPTDFRIVRLDVQNRVPLNRDRIRLQGRFRLPPVGDGEGEAAPALFRTSNQVRHTPTLTFESGDLTRLVEARVTVSVSPGNDFVFGLSGPDTSPAGTLSFNDLARNAPRVRISRDGSQARWAFNVRGIGRGALIVDMRRQTFDFRLGGGTILPSFEPAGFPVSFTLRTAGDVAAGREGEDAYLHHALLLDAAQPPFGRGRRVISKGEGVAGGTVFADSVTVRRRLRRRRGVAAPEVIADNVVATGTLRICPGSTPPATPGLVADLTLGDLDLSAIELRRVGRSGSRYRFVSRGRGQPTIRVDVDVVRGIFRLRAMRVPALGQLLDADFSGTSSTNDVRMEVAGMSLPFSISIARVYEASFDIPMVRRRGGRVFTR